jgi:beta-galactosidase
MGKFLWTVVKPDHKLYSERIMYASESFPKDALVSWNYVEEHPYIIGDFVWTAMDYLGESGLGESRLDSKDLVGNTGISDWPWHNAFCGDLDLIGNKKPQSYYRDVVWRNSEIEMMVGKPIPDDMREYVKDWGWPDVKRSWTWPGYEGKLMSVLVYSRCQKVKLEFNGKLIGEQMMPDNSITATFQVPYSPGTLVARGFIDGQEVTSFTLETTGVPTSIRLIPDRKTIEASRNELVYVSVEVVDDAGNIVPYVDDLEVEYAIVGNAEIAGVGNGNPTDMSSFQQPRKKVFGGRGVIILRPTGENGTVTLKATSNGLKTGTAEVIME